MKGPTLTIAIPAYNEEANIKNVLLSLLEQNYGNIKLQKIVVINDGSTDNTAITVLKLAKNYHIIRLINHAKRLGKVARLNEIYKLNVSDLLAIFDGDILPGNKNTVSSLYKALSKNPKAVLAAAHQVPIRVNTLPGRAIYGAYKIWDDARLMVPKYDNIQNFYGAASMYRKNFTKTLKIPSTITDERGYIYIKAKENGGFVYTKRAFIFYLPVNTLHDFWKLADRSFSKNRTVLAKMFGENVHRMYEIPAKYKFRSIVNNIIKSPFYTSLGIMLNIATRIISTHDKFYDRGAWETSKSTKKTINI